MIWSIALSPETSSNIEHGIVYFCIGARSEKPRGGFTICKQAVNDLCRMFVGNSNAGTTYNYIIKMLMLITFAPIDFWLPASVTTSSYTGFLVLTGIISLQVCACFFFDLK